MTELPNNTHRNLRVLYEDDELIAISKPAGMFVHRSEADRSADEFVLQRIRDQVGAFVFPVHRLDRATSGVLLLAKSRLAAAALGQLFADRAVSKTYHALVRGHCLNSGEIKTPLISARGRDKPVGHPFRDPQSAVTRFRTLFRYDIPLVSDRYPTTRCCMVEVQPVTGRYHQIRRHFNSIAHPIIGDSAHGDTRQNRFFAKTADCHRLMLAAVRIQLPHPASQRPLDIECPPEESFTTVLRRLESWRC
ncbi:MAG: pseudouridine synthase [Planctomycetaceae bacterium]